MKLISVIERASYEQLAAGERVSGFRYQVSEVTNKWQIAGVMSQHPGLDLKHAARR
jgi:hypothetical protein